MAGLGDIYKNHVLDALLGPGFTRPATVYIGLNLSAPTSADGHTSECTAGDYVRAAVQNDGTHWGPAASGATHNLQSVTFAMTSAGWGSITDFTVWDDPTSVAVANLVGLGHLTTPHTVAAGETAQFQVGDLTVTAA